eukprot:COSAG05_NODE_163_length_15471_cov_29.575072_5_plen_118_part_00
MGPELRKVADTIMSDLGMGEDQGKIDALEQYLEENLSIFFSEDSYMSSVIKMGAEKSFTSHSAKIKDFLTRGIGGGNHHGRRDTDWDVVFTEPCNRGADPFPEGEPIRGRNSKPVDL